MTEQIVAEAVAACIEASPKVAQKCLSLEAFCIKCKKPSKIKNARLGVTKEFESKKKKTLQTRRRLYGTCFGCDKKVSKLISKLFDFVPEPDFSS
jgi:hypothetical protein